MFYKFLNKRISSKIFEFHPRAIKYLSDDLEKSDNETTAERLMVFNDYVLLHKHFETDQKRLYMINRNYLNFLKAIIFIYRTSQVSVSTGVLTAPAKIYQTINAVQKSFKEVAKSIKKF